MAKASAAVPLALDWNSTISGGAMAATSVVARSLDRAIAAFADDQEASFLDGLHVIRAAGQQRDGQAAFRQQASEKASHRARPRDNDMGSVVRGLQRAFPITSSDEFRQPLAVESFFAQRMMWSATATVSPFWLTTFTLAMLRPRSLSIESTV